MFYLLYRLLEVKVLKRCFMYFYCCRKQGHVFNLWSVNAFSFTPFCRVRASVDVSGSQAHTFSVMLAQLFLRRPFMVSCLLFLS